MTVPDYLPVLVKGASPDPKSGGCLVQVANWLADPSVWSDEAICVHPDLVHPAIRVNDLVDDEHRRQLALLAPRLSDTRKFAVGVIGDSRVWEVSEGLCGWMVAHPRPWHTHPVHSTYTDLKNGYTQTIHLPRTHLCAPQDEAIAWLAALIDEFDRLTGRHTAPLPAARWAEVKELLHQ